MPLLTGIQNGFILFLFPLIGLTLEKIVSKKTAYLLMAVAFFFLLPIFTPWHYPFPYAYRILVLIICAAAYARWLQTSAYKRSTNIAISVIISTSLFFVLGIAGFIASFGGTRTVEYTWQHNNYRVQRLRDQGFSGRALSIYQLGKYATIPVLIRDMEMVVIVDTTNSCVLHFEQSHIFFNRCDGTILPSSVEQTRH